MGNFKLRWHSIAQVMLFLAAAVSWCGTALAQGTVPVNGFVIINPISVCSGGLCAPYGATCTSATGKPVCTQSPAPSLATTTTPIGFVDTLTNVNITRAFWAQAGIDVVFFPVQSYTSPTNALDSSWNNIKDASTAATFTYSSTNYQNLHLVNVLCTDGFIALTSPDFQALTQHSICTEHGGLAPGTWSKLVNPPPAPSTAPPLAINGCSKALPCSTDPVTHIGNSNAIDVFFVNTYGGTGASSPQYGFSWINGDGVSVGKVIFTLTQPRYDTFAHEIGHAVGLTHQNYGATNDPDSSGRINMMLLGADTLGPPAMLGRATSYNSGCQHISGNFSSGPPPILNNGALYDLDYSTSNFALCVDATGLPIGQMLADHLTTGTCTALDTTCMSQAFAAAASPFINKTSASNAGGGSCAPFCPPASATISTGAATTSTPSSSATPLAGTPAPLQLTISANGDPNDPNVPDLLSIIIALPPNDQLSFGNNSPVTTFVSCTDQKTGSPCNVTVTEVVKLTNQQVTGNPGCDSGTGQPPGSQCIRVTFSTGSHGFHPGLNVVLAVNFNKDGSPTGTIISQGLLAGAQYTSIDAGGVDAQGNVVPGFATTSLFTPVGTPPNAIGINANAASPDLTTSNVLLNASTFQNVNALPPPKGVGPKLAQCTPQSRIMVTVKIKNKLVTETVCPDGNLPDGGE